MRQDFENLDCLHPGACFVSLCDGSLLPCLTTCLCSMRQCPARDGQSCGVANETPPVFQRGCVGVSKYLCENRTIERTECLLDLLVKTGVYCCRCGCCSLLGHVWVIYPHGGSKRNKQAHDVQHTSRMLARCHESVLRIVCPRYPRFRVLVGSWPGKHPKFIPFQ